MNEKAGLPAGGRSRAQVIGYRGMHRTRERAGNAPLPTMRARAIRRLPLCAVLVVAPVSLVLNLIREVAPVIYDPLTGP